MVSNIPDLMLADGADQCSWTKVLTKSTKKFDSVITELRHTVFPQFAEIYGPLRALVVKAKLEELKTIQHVPTPTTHFWTEPQQSGALVPDHFGNFTVQTYLPSALDEFFRWE